MVHFENKEKMTGVNYITVLGIVDYTKCSYPAIVSGLCQQTYEERKDIQYQAYASNSL